MKISLQNINNNKKLFPLKDKETGNNFVAPSNATSSLDVISNYNKATVSFDGKIFDKYSEVKDKCQFYPQLFKLRSRLDNAYKNYELSFPCGKTAINNILAYAEPYNIEFIERLFFDEDVNKEVINDGNNLVKIVKQLNPHNIGIAEGVFYSKEKIFKDDRDFSYTLHCINEHNKDLAEKLLFGKNEKYEQMVEEYNKYHSNSRITYIIDWEEKPYNDFLRRPFKEISPELFPQKDLIYNILLGVEFYPERVDLAETLSVGKTENGSDLFPYKERIYDILSEVKPYNKEFIKKLCTTDFKLLNYKPIEFIQRTISSLNEDNIEIAEKMLFGTDENGKPIIKNKKYVSAYLASLQQKSDVDKLKKYLDLLQKGEIREQDILYLLNDISLNEYQKAKEIFGEKKLYSFPDESLVSAIKLSSLYKKTDVKTLSNEEKSDLLKSVMKQGASKFEENKKFSCFDFPLIPTSHKEYNELIQELMGSLGIKTEKISEEENAEFYKNIFSLANTLAPLSDNEFNELIIKDENQAVFCNNKSIEKDLNNIFATFPELNSIVEKKQHGTHSFDVLTHSLKVMQKTVQNPKFKKLNESDKKILLIASLFHDFSKTEGKVDHKHAENSAIESFYITNKLNLSKQEVNKLYNLIKHHEWLKTVNSAPIADAEEVVKTVSYNLYQSNLFELSKIFTEADLKAVKVNDDFYETYKLDFEKCASKVEKNIKELKNTQPLLPVTEFPSASRIKQAINKVYSNGRTNLPGIYQDEKGMVIIRYNEVENETWEKIGFPKGSFSKGVEHTYKDYKNKKCGYDTGNIKFFVHGLRRENQLRNFDAFVLPDSDALLSVSYAERPESKFRFYKPQGVIIKTDALNIHGGGKTDGGSGCKKTVDDFIECYAYPDSIRYKDRTFVSELIKKDLKLSDRKYQEFVEKNIDKPISEIEPESYQEKLIKAFAKINARPRSSERDYNEMYVSNPEVMGVYAYDAEDKKINDVMQFVKKQEDFIRNYALEKDIPFVVFDKCENI